MPPIIIRPATEADIADIQSIARRSWAEVYEGILASEIQVRALDSWYSADSLLQAIDPERSIFLVATTAVEAIGFIQMVVRPEGQGEITRIYVTPEDQRRGTGTMLLQDALDRLSPQAISEIIVSVEAQNRKGRSFYERNGFVAGDTSRRVELFGHPLELVTYRRVLGP
jgi:ribosomal protein S18 acetylase RimI-like enzyme